MPKSQLKKSNHDKVPGKHAVNNKSLVEESGACGSASFSQRDTKGQREEGNMANLDVILRELSFAKKTASSCGTSGRI
ncbi:hypothetical protein NQZ68_026280 [Dissostichus eleginoides]|uniref:50S ribosomal protein L3 n=1 Tax=Dissostichus eleginoides TaxID=100907 RepID=A0AAD9BBZ1_DISEL|nr:hypothetical protein NQZ68_026280 [Dissostichus eleginoides]KAK1880995.1 50S ribosomal protein L3 [Dissostichus eleginoides]